MGLNILAWAKSKKYTDQKTSQTAGLHREIVQSLPLTGDESVIYMVPVTGSGDDNYNEYMWINNAYELIGNTRVDLTDYYNKTQVDSALSGKANTATSLAGYGITDAYTKTEVDSALSGLLVTQTYWNASQIYVMRGHCIGGGSTDITKPGYTPIAVSGIRGAYDFDVSLFDFYLYHNSSTNKDTVYIGYLNDTDTDVTVPASSIEITILYAKS